MNKYEKAEKAMANSIDPLEKLFQDLNNDVVGRIVERLESFNGLSEDEVHLLIRTTRYADLKEIKKMISDASSKSLDEISDIIEATARTNDELYAAIYESKGIATGSAGLKAIKSYAEKNIKRDILNLSQTSVFVTGGKVKSIAAV